MARDPLAALRRVLVTRRAGWGLAAVLVLLGVVLGVQRLGGRRLTSAAGVAVGALTDAFRSVLGAGWLLLLLVAVVLMLSLGLSSRRGQAAGRWLRPRLTARPTRWAAAAACMLMVLVLVVVVLPPRFTAHRDFDEDHEELKAQNDVRTTLLQALAGGVLLLGAYVAYRQLRVTREGQITDRYTKAVDQLGSQHLDVRLGGIYSLERIARDSPPDRATIEEVLTAFVRGHAPWPPPPSPFPPQAITQRLVTFAQRQRSAWERRTAEDPAGRPEQGQTDEEAAEPQPPAADVLAAMTVLGRRQLPPGGLRPLDLTGVDLRRAELKGANLQGTEFTGANLQRAGLMAANLQDTRLWWTNLQGARLQGANLRGADLWTANLQGTRLEDADLQGVRALQANLQSAELKRANLRGARLFDANLQGAELEEASLEDAKLHGSNLQDAKLERANLQGARLYRANLQGARLYGANLQGARLEEANLQGMALYGLYLQGARLERADLRGALLKGADLRGARLQGAKLQGAQLEGADLRGAQETRDAPWPTCWPEGWDRDRIARHGVQSVPYAGYRD
jgi:uncharacterized protein YjbI with pentapeptide repeats